MTWLAQQPNFATANSFTISTSLAAFGTSQLSAAPPAGAGPDAPPLLCLPAPGVHTLKFHGRRMWIWRLLERRECTLPSGPSGWASRILI